VITPITHPEYQKNQEHIRGVTSF